MAKLKIAIVGYGTAGQTLAIALSRDEHDVTVYEQAENPGPVGAGFLLQPTGLAALWQLGLLEESLRYGTPIHRLYGENNKGRPVMDMRYAGLDSRLCGLGMQRGALFEILRNAWPDGAHRLHSSRRIISVDSEKGLLTDQHGNTEGAYDLIIAADGSGSQLRHHLKEKISLDCKYPWGALWCLLPTKNWQWPDELQQRYRAARQMAGILPVGNRPGDATSRASFFWSLPTSEFENWQNAPFQDWKDEVLRLWPMLETPMQQLTEHSQLSKATYRDVIVKKQWHQNRLVVIGDAAHAMSPQLGQGVNMALLDALALRDALRTNDTLEIGLAQFSKQRKKHVAIYQFYSRWLTPLFQSNRDLIARIRDLTFIPMGYLPFGQSNMLRVLSGTQQGLLGHYALPTGFIEDFAVRT
jgi:2-polyprenyl-6-methoxyphenol hydroxylase-like FAD-dependent oxidoreductase